MTRVVAQGAFDILHPGMVYYLRRSATLGDELHVILAADSNRPDLYMDEDSRHELVASFGFVDSVVVGSEWSRWAPVENLDPAIITIGYDQPYNEDQLQQELEDYSVDVDDIEFHRIDRWTGRTDDKRLVVDRVRARTPFTTWLRNRFHYWCSRIKSEQCGPITGVDPREVFGDDTR